MTTTAEVKTEIMPAGGKVVDAHPGAHRATATTAAAPAVLMPRDFEDLWRYAEAAAQSKLFPKVQTTAQAFTLMMLCHSKGLHFMQALERYDLVENRPALKSIALAADFKARGWSWKIHSWTDREASAWFSHPVEQPEAVLLAVKIEEFRHLTNKDVWKYYPRKMLWWRLLSLAADALEPGIKAGLPDAEEARDLVQDAEFRPIGSPRRSDRPTRPVETRVWGQTGDGPDGRPYHVVVAEAAAAFNGRLAEEGVPASPEPLAANRLHGYLMNAAIHEGMIREPPDRKSLTVITALGKLYGQHRDWLRQTLTDFLEEQYRAAREAHAEAPAEEAPDAATGGDGGATGRAREPVEEG